MAYVKFTCAKCGYSRVFDEENITLQEIKNSNHDIQIAITKEKAEEIKSDLDKPLRKKIYRCSLCGFAGTVFKEFKKDEDK